MNLFRIGVITDEISSDFEHALDVMLEFDVPQVEIRELWGKNVLKLEPEEMRRARTAIADRGMEVCSIASPFYKCSLGMSGTPGTAVEKKMHGASDAALEDQKEILRRACELAHFFGAPIIRVFAFWREQPLTAEVAAAIREAFQEPVALAEREGLVLGLENEHACMLGTGQETAPLLAEIQSPNFRAVWDPGNAFQIDGQPFRAGYDAIKPYLAHVHVKDAVQVAADDGAVKRPWTVIGAGAIDYPGQFRALAQDGYDGVVSLETHYRKAGGDAEASSRECLSAIRQILDRLS